MLRKRVKPVRVNERIGWFRTGVAWSDGRSVRPDHPLSARLGHRPLRPALLLLHVRRHDLPAEGGSADAGRTRPAVLGVHRQGRAEIATHRRRAAGPTQYDVAGALALASPRFRRLERADADNQRFTTAAFRC